MNKYINNINLNMRKKIENLLIEVFVYNKIFVVI
jgi:hypothetical protein